MLNDEYLLYSTLRYLLYFIYFTFYFSKITIFYLSRVLCMVLYIYILQLLQLNKTIYLRLNFIQMKNKVKL